MQDEIISMQRRGFLEGVVATAAVAGITAMGVEPAIAANPSGDFPKWLDSIKGQYRQVYDMPGVNDGMGLAWAFVLRLTAPAAYGVSEDDIGVVVVLRHRAIPLALNDSMWEKYPLGEFFKVNDRATNAPAKRNPYSNLKAGEWFADAAVDKLIAKGVRVAACNMAIMHYTGVLAKNTGGNADEIRNDWIANVIPGVTVVPSGVLALNGAQSKGCAYVAAG